jgi:hypothetical protein
MRASSTVCRSNVDLLMTLSTSAVADCCRSAWSRSQVIRATSVCWPACDEMRWVVALNTLRPVRFNALLARTLAGLPPALEGFFMPLLMGWERGIVAGPEGTGHGSSAVPGPALGDKGYDSKSNRDAARQRGICPAIPYRSNTKDMPAFFPKTLYKARARIAVGKLKRFKRIALRCEKTAQNYGSFVALALGFIFIKSVRLRRTSCGRPTSLT